MAGASFLIAMALAAHAGPARPPEIYFELGRAAFRRADYDACLQNMMLALIENPRREMTREYLRLASERIVAARSGELGRHWQELLSAHQGAIQGARGQALRWNVWLEDARRQARRGHWAAAYDGATRVVEENPRHEDALASLAEARGGLAKSLGGKVSLNKKDALLYAGLLSYARKESSARRVLEEALARSDLGAELPDERIQHYLDRFGMREPRPEPRVAAAEPRGAAAEPRPDAAKKPVLRPGQWAHAQGLAKLREGRLEEAVDLLERASSEAPQEAGYQKALVRARHELEAQRVERKAQAESLYTLGIVLYGQGKEREAVAQWRKAVELFPEHNYAQRALQHAEQELRGDRP